MVPFLVLPLLLTMHTSVSGSGSESAAAATRVAVAAPVEQAPVIDGKVDDDVWQNAEVITDFIQAEPFEGRPATEKTEVRIVYDNRNVYVGVICFDSDPSQMNARSFLRALSALLLL